MKSIPLSHGLVAIVDDEDYQYISRWEWFATPGRHTWYAVRTVNVGKKHKFRVAMHRQLEGAPEGVFVDHRDGDGLNNRRCNLRICMHADNAKNVVSRRGSSRFKGVSWHTVTSKWSASIRVDGKQRHLGLFVHEDEAARAYDEAAKSVYGEFARLNFPELNNAV